ncbi:hypothetical protein HDU85_003782 [Gaertneriomyces sp. JEL0708]|nr:hypothetical protein HDU85_003782 [Gaertneriomyces sp. JEL0708]
MTTESNLQRDFAFETAVGAEAHGVYADAISFLGSCIGFFGAIPCCFCCPNPYKEVKQGTVGLVCRFGRYYKTVNPGLHNINVLSESLQSVDIKMQTEDIPRQSVMTKDNVTVDIDSVLYWQVEDPYASLFLVSQIRSSVQELTMATLRNVVAVRTIQEAIEHRDEIAREIQEIVGGPAHSWGASVKSILIKDLRLSQELQETLASAAKQKRVGQSKIITAQAEVEAARLMREASDILNTPAAIQIRYLETMQAMAREAGTKVIFMPPDVQNGKVGMKTAFDNNLGTTAAMTLLADKE